MTAKRYLVDTNILLRFLTGEPAKQAAAARKQFDRAANGEIILDVSPVVVAEVLYTLVSFYGVEQKMAAQKLSLVLQQHGVRLRDEEQVFHALETLQTAKVGFADAFLAAGSRQENTPVMSFDRDFDKLQVARYEPTE